MLVKLRERFGAVLYRHGDGEGGHVQPDGDGRTLDSQAGNGSLYEEGNTHAGPSRWGKREGCPRPTRTGKVKGSGFVLFHVTSTEAPCTAQ